MASYSFTCSCGYTTTVDAPTRNEAVSMIQNGLTEEFIAQHMKEHHKPDEPVPTLEQARAMTQELVQPAA